jgi:hypothetical protein
MCAGEATFYAVGRRPFGEVQVGPDGRVAVDPGMGAWWSLFVAPHGGAAVEALPLGEETGVFGARVSVGKVEVDVDLWVSGSLGL